MQSMCYGSLLGSTLGTSVRTILSSDPSATISYDITSDNAFRFIATLTANLILAVIAIIIFARKRDVQPIMSIEDFWGSLLIGFLVGYNGEAFLDQILETPPSTSPSGTT